MLRLGESVRDDAAEIDALNCLHMHPLHPLQPSHLTITRCIDLAIAYSHQFKVLPLIISHVVAPF